MTKKLFKTLCVITINFSWINKKSLENLLWCNKDNVFWHFSSRNYDGRFAKNFCIYIHIYIYIKKILQQKSIGTIGWLSAFSNP